MHRRRGVGRGPPGPSVGAYTPSAPRVDRGVENQTASWNDKSPIRATRKRGNKVLHVIVAIISVGICASYAFTAVFPSERFRVILGLRATLQPLEVGGRVVHEFKSVEEFASSTNTKARHRQVQLDHNTSIRLPAFDDTPAALTGLMREWNLIRADTSSLRRLNPSIVGSHQRSNTCIELSSVDIRCLPSLFIVGFEKCSTTALSIWLSHHPNLQSRWLEGRFFDHINSMEELKTKWHGEYLSRQLPSIREKADVGQYWTLEKSPAYASAPYAPEMISALAPSARLIFMTRNPTRRAYSMFLMLTSHYPGVASALRGRPVSFFVKSKMGDVRYVGDRSMNFDIGPGLGGEKVPLNRLPKGIENNEWHYLSFPPDPKDFHNWIVYALMRAKMEMPNFENNDNSRTFRLLFGGFYATYLKIWFRYFPKANFVIVPSELLYTDEAPGSLLKLQKMLGLPLYDFSHIGAFDNTSGHFEVDSSAAWLNSVVNSYSDVMPMLDETKDILDAFYCDENRKLSQILGGRALPGYACT